MPTGLRVRLLSGVTNFYFHGFLLIYYRYFHSAMLEIYLYYTSAYPLYVLIKKISLANRNIKINVFHKKKGRPPLDKEIIELIIRLKKLIPHGDL